jgi:hypothetical protein
VAHYFLILIIFFSLFFFSLFYFFVAVTACLDAIRTAARAGSGNLLELSVAAARARATLGVS